MPEAIPQIRPEARLSWICFPRVDIKNGRTPLALVHPRNPPPRPDRAALREGESLIIFPEGTRGASAVPARFRSGLYRLATEFPVVELIPVYLDNLHRSLPKGATFPVPMVCTVRFGAPLTRIEGESREDFLERARAAVIALAGGAPAA